MAQASTLSAWGTAASAVSPARERADTLDAALLAAIARGDREAYTALYYRHSAVLFGFLLRILGSRAEAEEILQEVFLQVWRRASDFDESRGRAFPWLAMLTRSRALDRLATLDSRARSAAAQPHELAPDPPDPVEEAALAEEGRILRDALSQLPEGQRNVLLLAYFDGLSHSEIAARLAKPLGTVKSNARLGLGRLRELLRSRSEKIR